MANEKKDESLEEKEEKPTKKEAKKIDILQEENKKLKTDLEYWKNEYYRAYADTKNLRNALEKDHREAMKYRAEGFIDNLMPVLDSFHIALLNEPSDPALKNYLTGFQFIYRNLVTALEGEGLKEVCPKVGDKFDPAIMNAVDTVESEEKEGIILKVYGNGYKLIDRLVRPAMVQVSVKKKKDESKTDTTNNEKADA